MQDWLHIGSAVMAGALLVATVWDVVYWNAVARCDAWDIDNEAAAAARWMLFVYQVVLSVTFTRLLTTAWLRTTVMWTGSMHKRVETVHVAAWAGVDATTTAVAGLRLFYFSGIEDGYRALHYPDNPPPYDVMWWSVGAAAIATLTSRLIWLRMYATWS